jgi:hypothetical protein
MRAYRARPEIRERARELRALALATETPEEREERLAYRRMIDAQRREAHRAYHRAYKRAKHAAETPEEREARLKRSRDYYYANRERILRERREKRAAETPEEREARLAYARKHYYP